MKKKPIFDIISYMNDFVIYNPNKDEIVVIVNEDLPEDFGTICLPTIIHPENRTLLNQALAINQYVKSIFSNKNYVHDHSAEYLWLRMNFTGDKAIRTLFMEVNDDFVPMSPKQGIKPVMMNVNVFLSRVYNQIEYEMMFAKVRGAMWRRNIAICEDTEQFLKKIMCTK
ncbi:MAG: hypothetical protein ACD_84C00004G0005 [uncultured bacterium]|nr:MAG: hypothetical protein ACD_84C00004G0005 [uncultured bacterium]